VHGHNDRIADAESEHQAHNHLVTFPIRLFQRDSPFAGKVRSKLAQTVNRPAREFVPPRDIVTVHNALYCSFRGTWPFCCCCYAQSQMEHSVAKKPKKLEDLFHETLKDIYFAE